jgi:predicted lipoprotein with Yx(FWY)xxD motif
MLNSSKSAGGAPSRGRRHLRRHVVMLVALVTGAGLAVLTGYALAKTFTLKVATSGKVTSFVTHQTVTEPIAVTSRGRAVYRLNGDTVSHPLCTSSNGCYKFWPPVTVSSAKPKPTAAPGIKGRLGTKKLGAKKFQLTLNGQPVYTFSADTKTATATGEAINGFGGTWHVVKASGSATSTDPTGTTSTTTTTTCAYPPYC